jgi:hypothetical protein
MSDQPIDDAKTESVADRALQLRLTLNEEQIDADLWLTNDQMERRPDPALMIDDQGYCLGVLNQGQPVFHYHE